MKCNDDLGLAGVCKNSKKVVDNHKITSIQESIHAYPQLFLFTVNPPPAYSMVNVNVSLQHAGWSHHRSYKPGCPPQGKISPHSTAQQMPNGIYVNREKAVKCAKITFFCYSTIPTIHPPASCPPLLNTCCCTLKRISNTH